MHSPPPHFRSSSAGRSPGAIDWTSLHQRLEAARRATGEALDLPDERRRSILEERARLLAEAGETPSAAGPSLKLVTFKLGDEHYGIEGCFVREVMRMSDYTPLPGAPACLVGVMNFRGDVLSVIDPAEIFGLPPRGISERNTLIVLRRDAVQFGILADALTGMDAVATASLSPSVTTLTGRRRALTRGLSGTGIIVLDAHRLIVDDWIGGAPPSLPSDSSPLSSP